ncbi:helix-turn-helix domain-containing protein [Rhizobium sp. P38BS-XIX]|uniref:helix-turn-helix domain-containing protein n=1 Tax=Rhizobium sp. P38BS-XIX TaxID=2726740 RepID=UPI0014569132|nr:helix-turn-helix domain-containing protein [Rhizobium sp. P38BS-XIX]NLS01302.1 helix-turn-helix domain-containing protein [Rhizobium sp. P38BS-XIX]
MAQISSTPIFNFSTLDFPEKDRFHVWVKDNHCDCRLRDEEPVAFNAEAKGAALGPLILSGRRWLHQNQASAYEVHRTERHIRTDGHDFFRFTLVLSGRLLCRWTTPQSVKSAGELFVLDAAQINETLVESGDVISLVVPRDLLPSQTELLHGHTLSSGIGRLLGDHLLSLFRNLGTFGADEIPHIVQSTLQLITAAVTSSPAMRDEASSPIRDMLLSRILRYIDAHLLDASLTPDRICRDVGLSRAKLYQLFEGSGGIMRQIQRKRLRRAYQMLADPNRAQPHIAEVAWRHGFSNEKYFFRLFKAEFGHTPGETLENIRASVSRYAAPQRPQDGGGQPSGWSLPFGSPDN